MKVKIPNTKLIDMYKLMHLIREFEERIHTLYQQDIVYGAGHLAVGQEAIAVGVCSALELEDYVVSTHRGHAHCIAKGASIDLMMAELMAKETGYCKGKGGSQHIVDFNVNFIGAQGIVGAGIPIAVGSALSSRIRKKNSVSVSFFGDGATNTGSFHEGINMAACLNLPVIYVLENNRYAVTTCIDRSCKLKNLVDRAKAYEIPGIVVDGNNIFEVYEAAEKAVEYARKGNGPIYIEAKTYRWYGHFIGDPGTYRPKEELEEWKVRDPIKFLKKYLLDNNIISENDDMKIISEIKKLIDHSVKFGEDSPEPGLDKLLEDVYYSKIN